MLKASHVTIFFEHAHIHFNCSITLGNFYLYHHTKDKRSKSYFGITIP